MTKQIISFTQIQHYPSVLFVIKKVEHTPFSKYHSLFRNTQQKLIPNIHFKYERLNNIFKQTAKEYSTKCNFTKSYF